MLKKVFVRIGYLDSIGNEILIIHIQSRKKISYLLLMNFIFKECLIKSITCLQAQETCQIIIFVYALVY